MTHKDYRTKKGINSNALLFSTLFILLVSIAGLLLLWPSEVIDTSHELLPKQLIEHSITNEFLWNYFPNIFSWIIMGIVQIIFCSISLIVGVYYLRTTLAKLKSLPTEPKRNTKVIFAIISYIITYSLPIGVLGLTFLDFPLPFSERVIEQFEYNLSFNNLPIRDAELRHNVVYSSSLISGLVLLLAIIVSCEYLFRENLEDKTMIKSLVKIRNIRTHIDNMFLLLGITISLSLITGTRILYTVNDFKPHGIQQEINTVLLIDPIVFYMYGMYFAFFGMIIFYIFRAVYFRRRDEVIRKVISIQQKKDLQSFNELHNTIDNVIASDKDSFHLVKNVLSVFAPLITAIISTV